MLDYWVRLYRQYECPIEQVVIFLQETTNNAAYTNQLSVGDTQHRYRVVRLWEQDAAPLLTNPALLPLAVLARQQRNISACVEVLASLRFEPDLIRQYLREELMRESPIYQEIIQEGVQRGKQDTVIRLLTRRIGIVPPQLQAQVQSLSIEQLDRLSEALFDFASAADLTAWLQQEPRRQS